MNRHTEGVPSLAPVFTAFGRSLSQEMRPRESSWLTLAPLHVCGCMYETWRSTRALLFRSSAASSLHPWHVLRFRVKATTASEERAPEYTDELKQEVALSS